MRYDPIVLTDDQISNKLAFAAKLLSASGNDRLPEPLFSEQKKLRAEQLRRVKCIYGDGI